MTTLPLCYRCGKQPCGCKDGITLYHDDCLDVLAAMEPESVTAIVTDPPYGLEFMGKEWDKLGDVGKCHAGFSKGAPAQKGIRGEIKALPQYNARGNVRCRKCGRWKWGHKPGDGGGGGLGCQCENPVFPNVKAIQAKQMQTWHQQWAEAILRIAKPGAMLLAFGGTRTFHRLVCAIEDAGWEIRDCVMWVYGSGFPKSLNIGKAIDKAAGAERESTGPVVYGDGHVQNHGGDKQGYHNWTGKGVHCGTAPATEAAKSWDGFGTSLKPAWEPIIVAMKPLDGTFAANALKHGVAGINVDGCRVKFGNERLPTGSGDRRHGNKYAQDAWTQEQMANGGNVTPASGRWPANLIWSHVPDTPCPACEGDYPNCRLCSGTGVIKGCVRRGVKKVKGTGAAGIHSWQNKSAFKAGGKDLDAPAGYADADGLETVEDWDCHPDCPSRLFPETHAGITTRSGRGSIFGSCGGEGKNKQRSAFTDSGSAARFFYCAKADKAERGPGNTHPTVKPLALMEYLCRLVSQPGHKGTLLDPFAGSGSTLLVATKWFKRVIGIEREEKYCEIAAGRLQQEVLFT